MSSTPRPQYQRLLTWHIATLMALCALPLVGLVIYFLGTGLHREIAVAEREHKALEHMQKTVGVLEKAVEWAWSESGDDTNLMLALDQEVTSLHQLQTTITPGLGLSPLPQPAIASQSTDGLDTRLLWKNLQKQEANSPERAAALRKLAEQLHESMFKATDEFGLSTGPESEISALTDVVVVGMPQHVERVLHMHERMSFDLREHGWDHSTIEAASIFGHQLEEDDIERIKRSIDAALRSDAQSAKRLVSFQEDFPKQAEDLLSELHELHTAITPKAPGVAPDLDPLHFDLLIKNDFAASMEGWEACIHHLDALVRDQIHEAKRTRNQALILAGTMVLLLIPGGWLYFRTFIRPVLAGLIRESIAHQQAAELASAAADASTRRLQETQRALDDHCAVMVLDPKADVLASNDRMSRLLGYSREEMLGLSAFKFTLEKSQELLKEIGRDLREQGAWRGTVCHETKAGEPVWVDATILPLRSGSGNPEEFFVIETDITSLVKARKAAESATLAKSQFLAMMSHEIRTPMNGVIGFANLLAETELTDEQREQVRTIVTSGEALLVIINDILDFSKLEADRTELEPRPTAVRLLVEDVLDLLAAQARAKDTELVYWCAPEVPEGILTDENRLRQVLLNLVGNAVKFTEGGHIEVEVKLVPATEEGKTAMVHFHVRDTGIGIPPERVESLFQPFSQVDASITRRYGGTGLGLAISRRLVRLLGGDIEISSMVGEGSDFLFTLPAVEADVSSLLEQRSPVANLEEVLKGLRVLVVDDLPANRRLLETILSRYGVETVCVPGGEEAVRALEHQGEFDLAILDYVLPGESGVTLGSRVRELPEGKDLPMILLASAQPSSEEMRSGLFQSVISKPIRNLQFANDVARAIQHRRLSGEPTPMLTRSPAASVPLAVDHPLDILVVDDNPLNLKVIAALLKSLGYAASLHASAASALEALAKGHFDLVLMDVQMPDVDGHEATRRIRNGLAGARNNAIPIVALTAGAMLEERIACLKAGMDDFLSKPVHRGDLIAKLTEAALNKRPPAEA